MNLTEIILNNMWYKNGSSSTNYCKSIGNSNKTKVIDLDNSTITSPNGQVTVNGNLYCDDVYVQSHILVSGRWIHSNDNGDLVFTSGGTGDFIIPRDKFGVVATNRDFDDIKLNDLKSVGIAVCELMKAIPVLSSQESSMNKIEEIEDILDSQDINVEGV